MASTVPTRTRGEIITFYSYKGGTGRTMALANTACLLAERISGDAGGSGRGPDRIRPEEAVLVVDWDLEAPGLHRFLPPRLAQKNAAVDLGLDATPGLIDLFTAISDQLPSHRAESEEASEAAVRAAIASIEFKSYIANTNVPGVSILRAGRNDDGNYSRRVNTFGWEDLFLRAPTVYRAFADRVGEMFRYVLIDSRTGVTDISGICTSLLPERLVVVFTPNRQSLTGVRELVQRATSYRATSDDLRPLLIHPLPSRIEASLQDLRALWRFGSPDHNVVGYQPMFEEVFTTCYKLRGCDLSAYFDEVQIQQTPDYAYGEEIAVRRSSDRFSLANSYRVFVDRLISGAPPWTRQEESPVATPLASSGSRVALPPATPAPQSPPSAAAGPSAAPAPRRPSPPAAPLKAFLTYAPQDRGPVEVITSALKSRGIDVWDRKLAAGVEFSVAVEAALDSSDVVIVCWSKDSVGSDFVRAEADEGMRRGILIPVLLDDVAPPLGFRQIQAADLRRDFEAGVQGLVEAVLQIGRRSPGSLTPPAATAAIAASSTRLAAPRALSSKWVAAIGVAAGILILAFVVSQWSLRVTPSTVPGAPPVAPPPVAAEAPSSPGSAQTPKPLQAEGVRVPNFVGGQTADVQKAAGYLGLQLSFKDQNGTVSPTQLEGVVVDQVPALNRLVSRGSSVQLTVASATVLVPTVVGKTLDEAVVALAKNNLRLSTSGERPVGDVKPGTIVAQTPVAGAKAAAGSRVGVTIATPAIQVSSPSK